MALLMPCSGSHWFQILLIPDIHDLGSSIIVCYYILIVAYNKGY